MSKLDVKESIGNIAPQVLYQFAEIARLIYKEPWEMEDKAMSWEMEHFDYFHQEETRAFLCSNENVAVICFRGINRNSLTSILDGVNIQFSETAWGKIHQGVELALDEIWEPLLARITKTLYGQKIILTGHSLGGALAQLSCVRLMDLGVPLANLCTFGAPALGDKNFSNQFNFRFPERFFRVVNEGDGVVDLPSEGMGYYHSGIGLEFNEENQLLPVGRESGGFLEGLGELIEARENHSMETYLQKCLIHLDSGS